MSNVFDLAELTNVKMGKYGDRYAIFIRPIYPKDTPNHSAEFREVHHIGDLSEDEQVLLVGGQRELRTLYLALRNGQLKSALGNQHSEHLHPAVDGDKTQPLESSSVNPPSFVFAQRKSKLAIHPDPTMSFDNS